MSNDLWEVSAIRYAHLDRRSRDNFVGGDEHDVPMPLDYYVWVIQGGGRTILVDTGFGAESARKRGRQIVKPVSDGLTALGIDPGTVEDVVITHMHYDHAGNIAMFPRARFHVQDGEMAFATGRFMRHGMQNHGYEVNDVVRLVRHVYDDRVQFHDGAGELAPGIELHHVPGHTPGLQSVRVKTRRGWVVLASDASHFYAHVDGNRVYPVVFSAGDALEGYGKLRSLATSPQHIVPGHDPLVLTRYPAARPGTEGWIVRLDADPSA